MDEPLICVRVSFQGQIITVPIQVNTLDEASIRLPQGVYTTFRTFNHRARVLGLTQHLDRLEYSARRSGYLGRIDYDNLRKALRLVLAQASGDTEARVRTTLDLTFEPGALFITLEPLQPPPPMVYEQGICIQSSDLHRQSPDIKSTDFLVDTQPERHSMPPGVYELVMTDELGRILEGMTSNFFAVRAGTIYTARENVLSGVTRQAVLDLAHSLGLPIVLEPFSLAAIDQLDEAFITSSSRGLIPVIQINEYIIGEGKPGPVCLKLSHAYDRYIITTAELI
jgi:branched-subunit amino acid aminotransferase/4-amino-4-deoxychorismate lyase